ncbi:uncharacterized protein N7496_008840 [Penicillium cataractarum]|uniref:Uncharacterized protein n=1 Tax=Penicillium cataractarum TaxID=2100454 RepID=A0A9W9RZD1_9EURO|nr:uncharacterized protein N7496_008840 [Penicillium cataractarum]KAJ5369080.1 hypothetical protein N7496_008840 [Penicillium cataractarum]
MSGVEPDGRNKDKATPFSAAAMLNHLEVMQLLLSTEKVDIEALDYNRRTPLSLAAGNGHSDAVSFLLGTGAVDPDSKDKDGQTPLSWAAESGHVDVVKLLLATGQVAPDTPADNGKTALSHAAYRLPYISSTNGYEETRAKERLALEEIRRLLKGQAPLVPSIAASTRKEAPKSLPKSDPLGVMEELLKRNDVNPNSQDEAGETPLMFAVQRKHVDAVRILMETGKMKLNLRDEDGWTVFSYAQGAPKPIKLTKAQLDEAAWDTWEATL